MPETIEQKCIKKGVKLTEQRRVIAKVMTESDDHPNVDELYKRVTQIDSKISCNTNFGVNLCNPFVQFIYIRMII